MKTVATDPDVEALVATLASVAQRADAETLFALMRRPRKIAR